MRVATGATKFRPVAWRASCSALEKSHHQSKAMAKKKKYSKKAQDEVGAALHKQKRGQQRSGKKGKAKSRKQAIAIGLSKARKNGAKVPKKKSGSKK